MAEEEAQLKVKLIRQQVEGVEPLLGISVPSRSGGYDHIHLDPAQNVFELGVDAAQVAVNEGGGTIVVAPDSLIKLKSQLDQTPPAEPDPED
ncbi:MAG: hypothetical protein AB1631_29790 [Acidobacteriota bacterium]